MCDTVSELAAGTEEQWLELSPFLMQCVQSGNPLLTESALLIYAELVNYGIEFILKDAGALHGLLTPCMSSDALDVRLAAVKLAVALIDVCAVGWLGLWMAGASSWWHWCMVIWVVHGRVNTIHTCKKGGAYAYMHTTIHIHIHNHTQSYTIIHNHTGNAQQCPTGTLSTPHPCYACDCSTRTQHQ